MPSKKIAVLLNSSGENTALLKYAGCYAQQLNAKLCIISINAESHKQTDLPGMKHKLRLIERINTIFTSQALSFEIIITSSQNTASLASLFKEHAFPCIIISNTHTELANTLASQHELAITIFHQHKADSSTKCANKFQNQA